MAATFVVIGGGITGLVASLRLAQAGADVTLLEGSDRLGGKIRTATLDTATIELGADSFLPRDDRPLAVCREVGVAEELIEPSDFGAWVYSDGRLHRMPTGTVLGAPTSLAPLASSGLLSWKGKARAAMDLLGFRPLSGPDVSVASLVRSRLGAEVLERMVDPLLAGTRAGDVAEMSLAAAIPPVNAAARSDGSLIRGLRRASRRAAGKPAFYAPQGGMSRLTEAIEAKLQTVQVRKGERVASLGRDGSSFRIETERTSLQADAVLVTTPSYRAAELLGDLDSDATTGLASIPHASSAVVNLLFPPGGVSLPNGGSGVLVPSKERMTLAGCTWFSRKWPQHEATAGAITVRCFVGRSDRDPALDLDDRDLAGVVTTELSRLIEVTQAPLRHHVQRWDRGLPQYEVGHLDRVDRIESALARRGPIAVAGSSYRGSGIPDCIAQAETAAQALLDRVRR